MISDEGQRSAAYTMQSAAEMHLRAANMFEENVRRLEVLLGQGCGNNLELLLRQLTQLNESKSHE